MAITNVFMFYGIALAGIMDWWYRRIPWYLQITLYLVALLHGYLQGGLHGLSVSFLSSMVFFVPGYLMYKYLRLFGGADVKVTVIIGAWCGIEATYIILFIANGTAIIYALWQNLKNRVFMQEMKTIGTAFYLKFVCRIKGDTGFGQLSENIDAPSPENAVPFVSFLALAVFLWQIFLT